MEDEKHLPRAPRDLMVLAVLGEGPLHGYGIIKAVEVRSQAGVLLDPANLYRVLRRMSRLGWIRQTSDSGANVSAGRAGVSAGKSGVSAEKLREGTKTDSRRRTYEVTPHGKALLGAELARLERLLEHARPALADGPTPPWHWERDPR